MTPILAFDIETIPDVAGLRVLHGLSDALSDQDVVDMAYQKRRQSHGTDFQPLHLQKVVAISCALRRPSSACHNSRAPAASVPWGAIPQRRKCCPTAGFRV